MQALTMLCEARSTSGIPLDSRIASVMGQPVRERCGFTLWEGAALVHPAVRDQAHQDDGVRPMDGSPC